MLCTAPTGTTRRQGSEVCCL